MIARRYTLGFLFALVAIAALCISCFLAFRSNSALRAQLRRALDGAESAERLLRSRQAKDESAYWGENGDPVLLVRLNEQNYTELHQIKNSKYSGVRWSMVQGPKKTSTPAISYELRLLRSLEGVDYYRLNYTEGGKSEDLLFSFSGKAKIVASSSNLLIAISNTNDNAMDLLYEHCSDSRLRSSIEKWKAGQGTLPANIFTPFVPAAGRLAHERVTR